MVDQCDVEDVSQEIRTGRESGYSEASFTVQDLVFLRFFFFFFFLLARDNLHTITPHMHMNYRIGHSQKLYKLLPHSQEWEWFYCICSYGHNCYL